MPGRFARSDDPGPSRTPDTRLISNWPSVSVHWLAAEGLLAPNVRATVETATGGCQVSTDGLGNLSLDGQPIRVAWHRALPLRVFVCPRCFADRYRLIRVCDQWGCRGRRCHNLTHASRCRSRSIPALHRLAWLRTRAGADPVPFSPLPEKPVQRRPGAALWRRHWKLCREIRQIEERLLEHAGEDVSSVLERRYDRHGRS
jgi:hypothetical protein